MYVILFRFQCVICQHVLKSKKYSFVGRVFWWEWIEIAETILWPPNASSNPHLFYFVMTSSNGSISALLAICPGNSPASGEFPHKGEWRGALMFFFICAWVNGWVNNGEAGDLRRHHAHCDVIVMFLRNIDQYCSRMKCWVMFIIYIFAKIMYW